MEILKKQPETELEYWEIIDCLGGFIWQMNHSLAHGRIVDQDGSIKKEVDRARELSDRLVAELGEKFGVIHPKDCPRGENGQDPPPAPDGQVHYWDWYKRMKAEVYQREYDAIICSACPFSEGVGQMISLGGAIPCGVWPGSLYKLSAPHICSMVKHHVCDWTEETLFSEILAKHGETALAIFKAKLEKLRASAQKAIA